MLMAVALAQAAGVEPFLEDLLDNHVAVRDLAIRQDGGELYTSSQSLFGEVSGIIRLERDDDGWNEPGLVAFSGDYRDLEPFLSPDGLRMFFPFKVKLPAK